MNKLKARKLLISAGYSLSDDADLDCLEKLRRQVLQHHHPDRQGGNHDKFIALQTAVDYLISQCPTYLDTALSHSIAISLSQAFNGCDYRVRDGHTISILPGTRHGDTIDGVQIKITGDWAVNWEPGQGFADITKSHEVSAIKMILGGWEHITLLDGRGHRVWIPAGLPTNRPIKIQGAGYWRDAALAQRGDCYLWLQAHIMPLEKYSDAERAILLQRLQQVSVAA